MLAEELVAFRRDIHAHPELGRNELRTTAAVAGHLVAVGLEPRVLPGGAGLICDIGRSTGPMIALRADLDALPLPDDKDVPYRSTVAGACHACGHDVHTTMVLGAGVQLALRELPGRVRLIFQPAEEMTPGGALDVIAAGGLDDVRAIFALHCDPKVEVGRVGVRTGPITGASDMVEVRLSGPGGHTARPHLTADLVYAVARVVSGLPGLLSRRVDPRAGLSLVFGQVWGGSAANAIPQSAGARGTLRTLDQDAWHAAPQLVEELVGALVGPLGAHYEVEYSRGVPPVVNDARATAVITAAAATALGPECVEPTPQSLGGEDFAWYLQRVPGSLARLGVRMTDNDVDLHAGSFDVDERCLEIGVRLLVQTALDALAAYA
jgi:amidohydrolase